MRNPPAMIYKRNRGLKPLMMKAHRFGSCLMLNLSRAEVPQPDPERLSNPFHPVPTGPVPCRFFKPHLLMVGEGESKDYLVFTKYAERPLSTDSTDLPPGVGSEVRPTSSA